MSANYGVSYFRKHPQCYKEIEITFRVKFWIKIEKGLTAFKSKFSQQWSLGHKRHLL